MADNEIEQVADRLAKRASFISAMRKPRTGCVKTASRFVKQANPYQQVKNWWQNASPTDAAIGTGLAGAGLGGLMGLGSSMFKDEDERQPFNSMLTGALAGGLAGGGGSLAAKYYPQAMDALAGNFSDNDAIRNRASVQLENMRDNPGSSVDLSDVGEDAFSGWYNSDPYNYALTGAFSTGPGMARAYRQLNPYQAAFGQTKFDLPKSTLRDVQRGARSLLDSGRVPAGSAEAKMLEHIWQTPVDQRSTYGPARHILREPHGQKRHAITNLLEGGLQPGQTTTTIKGRPADQAKALFPNEPISKARFKQLLREGRQLDYDPASASVTRAGRGLRGLRGLRRAGSGLGTLGMLTAPLWAPDVADRIAKQLATKDRLGLGLGGSNYRRELADYILQNNPYYQ